jgi:branched-chain amino acid transport system ATP-binding protein
MGLNRTFQNIRLFQNMTVLENVLVGMHSKELGYVHRIINKLKLPQYQEQNIYKKAVELLEHMDLEGKFNNKASSLAYGEQRRLEIARALAGAPEIVLLDEPTAGMNPQEALEMMHMIESIRKIGVTVFIVEHNMKVLMGVSERIIVLDAGKKIAEGTPDAIRSNPEVIKAYLGTE